MTKADEYTFPRIELADAEWMSIIARDRGGLDACCESISDLRDAVIALAREDGEIVSTGSFLDTYEHAAEGHDLSEFPVLTRIVERVREIAAKGGTDGPYPMRNNPEPLRLDPREHVHDYDRDGTGMPERCPDGRLCQRWPRTVNVTVKPDGTRDDARTYKKAADLIASGILAASSALTWVGAGPSWQVPFYGMVSNASAELLAALTELHPMLYPDGGIED